MKLSRQILIPERQNAKETVLNIECIGEHQGNKPVVFVLPGGPGAGSDFYSAYHCLSSVADLVMYNPRGCGGNDSVDITEYTMQNYIDDLDIVRQELGYRDIVVLGKSYGSMSALGYVLQYPKAVSSLILGAGAPSYRFIELAKKNLQRRGTKAQRQAAEKLWQGSFKSDEEAGAFLQLMAPLYSNKKAQENTHATSVDSINHQALNYGFTHCLTTFNYEEKLDQIACPTLILAGQDDWVNDISIMNLMAEAISNAEYVVFEGSSHAMESDVTDQYFGMIKDFIKN